MKCTRRELDGNAQVVVSGGSFLSEAECALTWLSKMKTAVVKTRAEQLPALAAWLPCTGEEHCSISGSVLLQKQAEVPLACSKGYAQSGYL